MPDIISNASVVYSPINNKVYVFGGGNATTGVVSNATRIYDVAAGTWSAGTNMPDVRGFMAEGYFNGKIYLVGGYSTGNISPAFAQVWEYDPIANTFNTTRLDMPATLGGAGSAVINGHLYVAGGRDATNTVVASLYDYDIAANTWTTRAPMPSANNVPGCGVLNGQLWIYGGGNPFNAPETTGASVIYDPGTNAWSTGPSLTEARSFVAGTNIGNTLFAAGGYNGATTVTTTETLSGAGCPSPTPGITPTPSPGITPTPSATATPCAGGSDVIVDGGFENGGIPSSTWDPETSTNFGTPLCDFASCGNGGGASPPRSGLIWAWFGGIAAVETATLGQTVTIPSGGPATLHFWMRVGTVTAPFTDVMNVRVDGAIVQSYPEPAVAETDYTERVIDLTAFANGASHALLFEYIGPTTGTGSYVIDDVSLIAGGACPSATPSIPPSATPSPTVSPCPPSWLAGPNFPAVGAVRAPGNYFPANGRFYSIGGRSSDTAGSDFTNPFEYNPGTNAWTTKPSALPDNQVNNMACGVLTVSGTDQIYCVGGSAAGATTATARVFSYNPATDTFTVLAAGDNWPGDASGTILPGGFAVAGNKLYIFGGFNIGADATAQTWQFDPTLGVGAKWLQRQNLPLARGYVPAASIGGLIYTGGGASIVAATLTDTVDSFKYDPVANTWTPIANIPRATGETRAVVMNGQMWVLGGGRVAPNPSNEVDIYNPGTNSWSVGLPFGAARRNFPADSDGTSRIFLAGGYDTSSTALLNTMKIFSPDHCASQNPSPR
jgi:N-acetylneuraminic acid mutarotase